MSFANQTIILTGASAGIGRALALSLAQQGANLVLAARNQAALEEIAAACTNQTGSAIAIPTDVTQPETCQQLVEKAIATFGQIDILINVLGKSNAAPPRSMRSAAAMLGAISVMLSTSEIVKGTLLFVPLNIEVSYCREIEPD